MMLIHTVTKENKHLYEAQLRSMHQLRKERLIDDLKWKLQEFEGGERDNYDDDETVYFLAFDEHGAIEVCMRGRKTIDKCMLDEVFPHLLSPDWPSVRQSDVFEVSRYVVSPHYRSQRRGRVAQVFLASTEYGCEHGYSRLVGLCDLHVWPSVEAMPWRARMTGLPRPYKEGVCVGIEMACEAQDVISFKERLGLMEPISFELSPDAPYARLSLAEIEAAVGGERRARASDRAA